MDIKTFRGFRVKPTDRGTSYLLDDSDAVYEGETDSFSFIIVAKDDEEANRFAVHALGEIPYKLKLNQG